MSRKFWHEALSHLSAQSLTAKAHNHRAFDMVIDQTKAELEDRFGNIFERIGLLDKHVVRLSGSVQTLEASVNQRVVRNVGSALKTGEGVFFGDIQPDNLGDDPVSKYSKCRCPFCESRTPEAESPTVNAKMEEDPHYQLGGPLWSQVIEALDHIDVLRERAHCAASGDIRWGDKHETSQHLHNFIEYARSCVLSGSSIELPVRDPERDPEPAPDDSHSRCEVCQRVSEHHRECPRRAVESIRRSFEKEEPPEPDEERVWVSGYKHLEAKVAPFYHGLYVVKKKRELERDFECRIVKSGVLEPVALRELEELRGKYDRLKERCDQLQIQRDNLHDEVERLKCRHSDLSEEWRKGEINRARLAQERVENDALQAKYDKRLSEACLQSQQIESLKNELDESLEGKLSLVQQQDNLEAEKHQLQDKYDKLIAAAQEVIMRAERPIGGLSPMDWDKFCVAVESAKQ